MAKSSYPQLLQWNAELPAAGMGDPLGMTLRVGARLAAELLHCITSVTPRARYYSFFPWAFGRAARHLGEHANLAEVSSRVLLDERAMTLGAVLHHAGPCAGGALQGSTAAQDFVGEPASKKIDLTCWRHLGEGLSGFAPYKGSLISLGIFEETVPAKDEGAIDDLEIEVEGSLAGSEENEGDETSGETTGKLSPLGEALAAAYGLAVDGLDYSGIDPAREATTLGVLQAFGAKAGLCELLQADAADLGPLRSLFFAEAVEGEENGHARRRASLRLFLYLVRECSRLGLQLDRGQLDDITYFGLAFDEKDKAFRIVLPSPLHDIAGRWGVFHFHGYLVVALEVLIATEI